MHTFCCKKVSHFSIDTFKSSPRYTLIIISMEDTYFTLKTEGKAQYTEKRSKFLSFAMHVNSEEEAKEVITKYKKEYFDARHVCYAYVIGNKSENTRANGDGEPSGTADRPILGQIQARKLTYVLCIVVRYFGGVKLGTGPLGVAYKTAISDALDKAEIEEVVVRNQFRLSVPYADADTAMRFVREGGADIILREYDEVGTILTISVRLSDEIALRERLAKILSAKVLKG